MLDVNKGVVLSYFNEVVLNGHVDKIDELMVFDYINHSLDDTEAGRDNLKRRVLYLRGAFPNVDVKVEDLIAEGDRVVARWTMSGRHQGIYSDSVVGRTLPTGRDFTMNVISIFRFDAGRIAECWSIRDRLSRLQQLGLLPEMRETTNAVAS